MITVTVSGDAALVQRLDLMPQRLRENLAAAVGSLSEQLRGIVDRKLSGEVLQRRSGALAASVDVRISQNATTLGAALATDIRYAAIHEYGGTIAARELRPQGARALAFPWRGKQRFFARVEIPQVKMPERSFMRAALDEIAPEIRAVMAEAAQAAVLA